MNRIAKDSRREYHSALREEQAEETRRRILDATVRVIAGGLASASIPAVAREAQVSVPTVYRHFGTKEDLFAALYPHVVYRAASARPPLPASLDEFGPGIRRQFASVDALGDAERAAMASPAAREVRRANMPARIELTRQIAESIVPADSPMDRERLTRLLVVLTGMAAFRTWRDDLGCSAEEAADDVDWAVRALIAAGAEEQR
jgi:AcrR family transcriptional regulator